MAYVYKIHVGRFCPACVSQDCEHTRGIRNPNLLTARMVEILRLCGERLPYKEIAYQLGITEGRVRVSIRNDIAPRIGVGNRRIDICRWVWEHAERLRAPVSPDVYMFPIGV